MTGKQERQRKLAREHFERQQAKRASRRDQGRLVGIIVGAVVLVGALTAAGIMAFGGGSSKPTAAGKPTPSAPATSATPTPPATPAAVTEPAHHCVYIPAASPVPVKHVGVPPATPNWRATYTAQIVTNRGTIGINLLNSKATCTVGSFVYLAQKNYFSNSHCHRLTEPASGISVLQCGDPSGTGQGTPGYGFANENLAGATYPPGTVAMANTGQPNSNGSQFFLVYGKTTLPPNYTPFGTITSGLGIIQNVAKAGVAGGGSDGHPKELVEIKSVTIKA